MIKATRVGDTVVCIIENKMYTKNFSNDGAKEFFEKLANTDETNQVEVSDLKMLFAPIQTLEEREHEKKIENLQKEAEIQKSLLEWMQDIRDNGDEHFEIDGMKLFMKGINITVPEFLALEFAKRRSNNEDFKSLSNFWRLCALNPDPRCREDLYNFLIHNDMTVTPSGYFIAYRNVDVKVEGNRALNEFVAKIWSQIKRWKKAVFNYSVYLEDGGMYNYCKSSEIAKPEFQERNHQVIGNLKDLYENISMNEGKTIYTDNYTHTTEIVIGQPVKLAIENCDTSPEVTCSHGLHAGNSSWLKNGYCGSQGLAILINPRNVIAVPYNDGGKLRCCEYLPISTIEYDEEGHVKPFETATFEYEYSEYSQEELETQIKESSFESLKVHEIIPKEISIESLKNIIKGNSISLEEMNKSIKDRNVIFPN